MSTDQEKQFDSYLNRLRKLWRAAKGMPLEENDSMRMLVNEDDSRERSRLSEPMMWTHDAMEVLAEMYPKTFGFLSLTAKPKKEGWAEIEDVNTIPLEGEQRKEFILGMRAKTELAMPQNSLQIQMPITKPEEVQQTQGQQQQPAKKKGGIFHRGG